MKKSNTNFTETVLTYTVILLIIATAVSLMFGMWGGLWLLGAAILISPTTKTEGVDEEKVKKIIAQYEKDKEAHKQTVLDLK